MRVLALDFETGGLVADQHGPVTLGVALMEGEEVLASREWLFAPDPRRRYEDEAARIHGITLERMQADGWPVVSVMIDLRDFVAQQRAWGIKVVAYNAPFDFGFYSSCLFLAGTKVGGRFRHAHSPLMGVWHCAAILARELLPQLDRHKLDDVAAHFGLARTTDKHGALEDAILAGRVYARLQALHAEARKEGNVATGAEGPVAEAQRRLAECPRDSAEYETRLQEMSEAMKVHRAGAHA